MVQEGHLIFEGGVKPEVISSVHEESVCAVHCSCGNFNILIQMNSLTCTVNVCS